MERTISKTLEDIRNAILEVDSFFETRPKRYEVYLSDLCLRRAVERNITIIGEAMNRLLKIAPEMKLPQREESLTPAIMSFTATTA